MTNITAQRHYKAMYIKRRHTPKQNIFLGVAFEIEKPVQTVFKSFWNVLTSPVNTSLR